MGQPAVCTDQRACGNADADAGLHARGEPERNLGAVDWRQRCVDDFHVGHGRILVVCFAVVFERAFWRDGELQPNVDQRLYDLGCDVHRGSGYDRRHVCDHDHGDERQSLELDDCEPYFDRGEVELQDLRLAELADGDARIVGQLDDYAERNNDGDGDVLGFGHGQW